MGLIEGEEEEHLCQDDQLLLEGAQQAPPDLMDNHLVGSNEKNALNCPSLWAQHRNVVISANSDIVLLLQSK